jgi:4-diphosphocytidyl-2-C-methyl-D-erythritol kinase
MLQMSAYAKINLFLDVTGRRADGYHTILSHMQAITLSDVLDMALDRGADGAFCVELSCNDTSLSLGEDNLICRAAYALARALEQRSVACVGRFRVHLHKNIPMAAGLAGGSADAAATLRGLNALLGEVLSMDELCEIGVRLGADVPFCLRCVAHGAMSARGIGEVLTAAPTLPRGLYLVVACHGEGVSTPWAYRRLDELGLADAKGREQRYACFLAALEAADASMLSDASYNCFEEAVLPEREAVSVLMEQMRQCGAVFARMSGSGPSVVGVFQSAKEADACAKTLQENGIRAVSCAALHAKADGNGI